MPVAGAGASTAAPGVHEQAKSSPASADDALRTREELAKKFPAETTKEHAPPAKDIGADQMAKVSEGPKPRSEDLQATAIHTEEKPAVAPIASLPEDSKSGADSTRSASPPPRAGARPAPSSEGMRQAEARGSAAEEDSAGSEPLSPGDGKRLAHFYIAVGKYVLIDDFTMLIAYRTF